MRSLKVVLIGLMVVGVGLLALADGQPKQPSKSPHRSPQRSLPQGAARSSWTSQQITTPPAI
jgi:Tfp pilus assembly protein PilV